MKWTIARVKPDGSFKTEWLTGEKSLLITEWPWTDKENEAKPYDENEVNGIIPLLKADGIRPWVLPENDEAISHGIHVRASRTKRHHVHAPHHISPQESFEQLEKRGLA